jgi:hypothetical protein
VQDHGHDQSIEQNQPIHSLSMTIWIMFIALCSSLAPCILAQQLTDLVGSGTTLMANEMQQVSPDYAKNEIP